MWSIGFFVQSALLGVGLAMDAFSVSLANGLNEPQAGKGRVCAIAGVFAFFQALMPMLGWLCVHTVLQYFSVLEKLIPWIALGLLAFIGGSMLAEGLKKGKEEEKASVMGLGMLLTQGVATSIDALSVGFTIANYGWLMALVCALIIAAVTFLLCVAGVCIGKCCGTKLADKASVLGGVILIAIGLEIFITGVF